ncbi:MAG: hypothetical protein ACM3WT_06420 [Bacillota bacterium]
MLLCPHCGARGIGKVGSSQYYCWECCVEFRATRKGWLVYEVLDDGSLAVARPHDRSCDRACNRVNDRAYDRAAAERDVAGRAVQEGAIGRT